MGKFESQLPVQQQQHQQQNHGLCQGCSMGLSRIGRLFSFKCILVLLLTLSLFLSAIFWVSPSHSKKSGFEARDSIKLSATVQASFKLQKAISLLVPQIPRLEYDINAEIGVPYTKVAILSMHQAGASNWTYVLFGVLSDPINTPINAVSLSVLRSSLIELFLQQSNLTLTTSIFGQPSSFEILKFPGGITVIPEQSASIWMLPQILFNFTLPNSIYEIKENCVELKNQLKLGLHLKASENVYVQVTNKDGSSKDSPVTVQASVLSDVGGLLPQRLKQLAQTITGSPPAKNLGLNNAVFGKVKEISLSSYLNSTLHATPPTLSPAPSPELNDYAGPSISPSPDISPSYSPAPLPCLNCDASSPRPDNMPHHSLPPVSNFPAPSVDSQPPHAGPHCGSKHSPSPVPMPHNDQKSPAFPPHTTTTPPLPTGSRSEMSPSLSPLPSVSYGSRPVQDKGNWKGPVPPPLASPSASPSSSSSTASHQTKQLWLLCFLTLVTLHIL